MKPNEKGGSLKLKERFQQNLSDVLVLANAAFDITKITGGKIESQAFLLFHRFGVIEVRD